VSEVTAPSKLEVGVMHNGISRALPYHPHEHGHALFEHACHAFEIHPRDRGTLALYLPDNSTEVPSDIPIKQGGVRPDTTLILRPREASTGAAR
jgi:hypothetical protein